VAVGLWAMQPWAWLTAMLIAGLALLEAFIAFIQFPGTGYGFAMSLLPILIIIYLMSSNVKAAFGMEDPPAAS
jgi:hypothetical protein